MTRANITESMWRCRRAEIPGDLIACLEWQRIPSDRMRRDLQTRRRHFFNKRVALVNYVSVDAKPEEMLVDDSASATVRQLGDALTETEVNGRFFEHCSLTVVLHGHEPRALQQQVAEASKALAIHDGVVFEETYNLLNAWLSVMPGNGAHNLRRLALLETNAADLSFVFTLDQGERVNAHLQREALAIFETPHHTPYAFNLHVQDVGHMLVLGATGSGKSFVLNFLVTHAQKYEPLTIILDLGHSYRKLATLLGGSYLEIGLRHREVTINPFALEPTPEHLHFLHAFVRVLLEGDDGYRLSELEDREVYEAVENLYMLDDTQRRLFTGANLLPRALAARLHKWIEGGRYADLFDNLEDTLTVERLQVFDFEATRAYPTLLEPLLFYVLHRVVARIQDPGDAASLKLCVMDEAWRFIQHPTLRAYVQEGLKTWRKRNAAMILATQTVEDFASADLLRTGRRELPDEAAAGESLPGSAAVHRAVSVERDGAGFADRAHCTAADPAQAPGPGEGPHPDGRPQELLDLHEHSHRQRAGRRDIPTVRIRGGHRPSRRILVMVGRYRMSRNGIASIVVSCIVASALPPATGVAQTAGIREVSASSRSLITLQTRLRYTTMIVLPDDDEILDVICGDRDYWVISATHNIAHVKPAKEGASTNLNLVTASGSVYSFLLSEKNASPDLKVYVNGDPTASTGKAKYYSAAQVEALQAELKEARAAVDAAGRRADETIAVRRRPQRSRHRVPIACAKTRNDCARRRHRCCAKRRRRH